jgi:hypothetical protein
MDSGLELCKSLRTFFSPAHSSEIPSPHSQWCWNYLSCSDSLISKSALSLLCFSIMQRFRESYEKTLLLSNVGRSLREPTIVDIDSSTNQEGSCKCPSWGKRDRELGRDAERPNLKNWGWGWRCSYSCRISKNANSTFYPPPCWEFV